MRHETQVELTRRIFGQRGAFSGAQKFVTYGRNEPAPIHYHRSLRQALRLPD